MSKKFKVHKQRIPKVVKRTLISALVLLVLILIAGAVYVYMNSNEVVQPTKKTTTETSQIPAVFKPTQPAANAREGVALQSIISPVKAGANSSISILTNANSNCKISVTYNDKVSTDSGLNPKVANAYGSVTWTWTVDPAAPVGKWPVKVTCVYNKKSGVLIVDLVVTK